MSRLLYKTTKFGLKVAIVAAAVKISVDNDIWSLSTEKGAVLYHKLKTYIVPGTIVYPEKIPSGDQIYENVSNKWNDGVHRVFTGVEELPEKVSRAIGGTSSV